MYGMDGKTEQTVGDATFRKVVEETLEAMKELSRTHEKDLPDDVRAVLGKLVFDARAALDSPIRNYEVGTVEEQMQRFDAFCDANKHVGDDGANWCSTTCPCYNDIDCGVHWAQMPYEEQ